MSDETLYLDIMDGPVHRGADYQNHDVLSRRLRVLLHLEPLFRLRAGDARRDPELRHYDALSIALRILDIIAEHMGLDDATTADGLFLHVRDVLGAMDALAVVEPSPARQRRIFDRVLAALRNEEGGFRPFRIEWPDIGLDGVATSRTLSFRLIEDAFGTDGTPVLRLSPTAINLVFSALEMDIEDAQTATEAIVQSQIRRGRFSQAAQSARNALNQSLLYQRRIRRILHLTRRDIGRVDWTHEAPALIDDALEHLDERLVVESAIRETAHARLDHLQPGTPQAQQVARIAELVGRCIDHHTLLQRDLMEARSAFLDAQARQAFVPRRRRIVRSLFQDALLPALHAPAKDVAAISQRWVPTVAGARSPKVFNLSELIDGLLSPRQERRQSLLTTVDVQHHALDADVRYFEQDDRDVVANKLAQMPDAVAWGDWLASPDLSPHQRHLLAIESLAWADPDDASAPPLRWGENLHRRRQIGHLWLDDFRVHAPDAVLPLSPPERTSYKDARTAPGSVPDARTTDSDPTTVAAGAGLDAPPDRDAP